jgi:hypothetical protein
VAAVEQFIGAKVSTLGAAAEAIKEMDEAGIEFGALDFFRAIYRSKLMPLEARAAAAKAALPYEAPKPVVKAGSEPEEAPRRAVSAAAESLNAKLSALAQRRPASDADGDADGRGEGSPSLRLDEVAEA